MFRSSDAVKRLVGILGVSGDAEGLDATVDLTLTRGEAAMLMCALCAVLYQLPEPKDTTQTTIRQGLRDTLDGLLRELAKDGFPVMSGAQLLQMIADEEAKGGDST